MYINKIVVYALISESGTDFCATLITEPTNYTVSVCEHIYTATHLDERPIISQLLPAMQEF